MYVCFKHVFTHIIDIYIHTYICMYVCFKHVFTHIIVMLILVASIFFGWMNLSCHLAVLEICR